MISLSEFGPNFMYFRLKVVWLCEGGIKLHSTMVALGVPNA